VKTPKGGVPSGDYLTYAHRGLALIRVRLVLCCILPVRGKALAALLLQPKKIGQLVLEDAVRHLEMVYVVLSIAWSCSPCQYLSKEMIGPEGSEAPLNKRSLGEDLDRN
jgi:hypothetical protein